MPEEIAVIVIVAIIAGTLSSIVKSIMSARGKRSERSDAGGASLTTSELRRLMQEAVGEAHEEVMARFDALEHRLDALESRPALPAHSNTLLDAELDQATPESPQMAARRSRS